MSAIQNISSQLMAYPSNGIRKQGALAGRYLLDFTHGLVVSPNGTNEQMSKSLATIGKQFCKSVFITVSTVDAKIKIGQNILPVGHQLTYVISGIAFETMEIEFPTGRTPANDFSFLVIGSDSDIFPISTDVLLAAHNPTPQTGNTGDAYVTVIDFSFRGYSQVELIIQNTGGANQMTADVQVSENDADWVSAQGYPIDVAINDANVFQSSVAHKFGRVRLKSKLAGNSTTYKVQGNLEK